MNKRKNIVRVLALLMVVALIGMNTGIENVAAFYATGVTEGGSTVELSRDKVSIMVQLMQCTHEDEHYANGQHVGDVSEDKVIKEIPINPQVNVDTYPTGDEKDAAGLVLPDTNKYIYEYEMSYAEGEQVDYAIITQPYVTHFSEAYAAANGIKEKHNRMYWIGEYNSSIPKLTDNYGVDGEGADGEINWYDFNGECNPQIDMSLSQQTWETVDHMDNQDERTFVMNPDIGDDCANGQRFLYLIEGTFMNKDIGNDNHKPQQDEGIPAYYGSHIYSIVGLIFYRTLDFNANGGNFANNTLRTFRVYTDSSLGNGFVKASESSYSKMVKGLDVSCPTDTSGAAYVKPAERDCYKFLGWYAPKYDNAGNIVREPDGTVVCSDVPIYDINGNAVLSYSVNNGEVTTYTDMSGDNASPYFELDGTGKVVWKYKGNVTAYAKWEESYYTLKYTKGETNLDIRDTLEQKCMIGKDVYLNDGSTYAGSDYTISYVTRYPGDTVMAQYVPTDSGRFPFTVWNIKGNNYDPKNNPVPSLSNTLKEALIATAQYGDYTFNLPTATRDGYDLEAWYTNESFTGTAYQPGDEYTLHASSDSVSLTFYAKWVPQTKILNFDYNVPDKATSSPLGYVLSGNEVDSKLVQVSKAVGDLPSPELTGYECIGWSKYPDADVPVKEDTIYDNTYTTVYAQWIPVYYTIEYVYNGGAVVDNPKSANYYDEITIKSASKNGCDFSGWRVTGLDSSKHIIDGVETVATSAENVGVGVDSVKVMGLNGSSVGPVVFEATWEERTFNITYIYRDIKSGAILVPGVDPNTKEYTVSTSSFPLVYPNITGYNPKHWTGTGISGIAYSVNITQGSTGNRSYTGWYERNKYNIRYNLNGGEWGSGSSHPASAEYNSAFTVSNPVLSGCEFLGWTITGMCNDCVHTIGGSSSSSVSEDGVKATTFKNLTCQKDGTITFTANWSKTSYDIIYDLNGGEWTSGASHPSQMETWTAFNVTNPTKSGCTFSGWRIENMDSGFHYINGKKTEDTYVIGAGKSIAEGSDVSYGNLRYSPGQVKFTAAWDSVTRQVVFQANGGKLSGQSIQNDWTLRFIKPNMTEFFADTMYGVTWGTGVPNVSKKGYSFNGWFDALSGGNSVFGSASNKVTGDYWDASGKWKGPSIILYAQFTPKEYKVTFNLNGGYWAVDSSTNEKSVDVTYDDTKNNKVFGITDVYRPGYEFQYWNTIEDGSGFTVYDKDGKCKNDGGYWSEDYIE